MHALFLLLHPLNNGRSKSMCYDKLKTHVFTKHEVQCGDEPNDFNILRLEYIEYILDII
jgi:hypothetical protein